MSTLSLVRPSRRGRPPKPTATKIKEGNRGRRPLDPLEPKPAAIEAGEGGDRSPRSPSLPPAPGRLDEGAARVWEELGAVVVGMKVMTEADLAALELLARAEAWRRELEDDLQENGRFVTVQTRNGEVRRRRPEAAEAEKVTAQVSNMLREFGLTPASRPKVQMVPGKGKVGRGEEDEGDNYFG